MAGGSERAEPALRAWTVSALLLAAADALEARFGAVAVRGEVSGFTRAASGHCYFSLKDGEGGAGAIRCVMFRRQAGLLQALPRDGQQVELRGRLGVYEARGELQMVVESLRPVGMGSLYEEFLRLRARLQAQGWFDADRKRPLPALPATIGVVTSPAAAAWHDVVTALRRRAPHVQVVLYPCSVQGVDAPASIVAALDLANRQALADVLIVSRGGGSIEDLWAFNDERVVRAVALSGLPVICGVGHETDVTLADLAADLRAPTPTAAAELASPARGELWVGLAARAQRMAQIVERRLDGAEQQLDRVSLKLAQPARRLGEQQVRLEMMQARLRRGVQARLQQAGQQLDRLWQRQTEAGRWRLNECRAREDGLAARLAALDPRRVLSRGYAWVEAADSGLPLLGVAGLVPGQAVRTVWHDGAALARIESVQPGQAAEQAPSVQGGTRGGRRGR